MLQRMLRFITLLLAVCCCAGASYAAQVIIVSSERSAAYVDAMGTLTAALEKSGVPPAEVARMDIAEFGNLDPAVASATKVWVSLGAAALQKLLGREGKAPVLAALVPRSSYERVLRDADKKPAAPVFALYLDQPWGRQLDLLRLALPDARRVGVLWGPESVVRKNTVNAVAQEHGMELNSATVSNGALFPELKAVLDGSDVLLAVPDPQVFNSATISNLLLSAYRARIPLVAFSPAYVKAGALLSLHSTPEQIGTQAAGIVRALLQGAAVAPAQYPNEFTVTVNERVAQSLGLQLNANALSERLRKLERKP